MFISRYKQKFNKFLFSVSFPDKNWKKRLCYADNINKYFEANMTLKLGWNLAALVLKEHL